MSAALKSLCGEDTGENTKDASDKPCEIQPANEKLPK